jgi:Fe-Mn family superoxide dismutase
MAITLPELPYAKNALEPVISARTLEFHHGKHHAAYVANTNKLIEGTDLAGADLVAIVKRASADASKAGLFNNAAQVWNHTFFWHCMKPGGGGKPTGELAQRIGEAFGSYEKFAEQFKAAAVGRFGSGWGWLVSEAGSLQSGPHGLKILSTPNAETPMTKGQVALLTVDVWEHAYYLDYQNRRPDFVQAFLDHLVNWDFVAENFAQAK